MKLVLQPGVAVVDVSWHERDRDPDKARDLGDLTHGGFVTLDLSDEQPLGDVCRREALA